LAVGEVFELDLIADEPLEIVLGGADEDTRRTMGAAARAEVNGPIAAVATVAAPAASTWRRVIKRVMVAIPPMWPRKAV